jgi:hypothetical protein
MASEEDKTTLLVPYVSAALLGSISEPQAGTINILLAIEWSRS